MNLFISADRLISETQRDFNTVYPFLKIEFFKNGNVWLHNHAAGKTVSSQKRIKDAGFSQHDPGELFIHDLMKVSELEAMFGTRFGLAVQVFRRSGNIWLGTTMTDDWTLKQQNDHGQEITFGKKLPDNKVTTDYDLDRDSGH
jgi:hypothetical protein